MRKLIGLILTLVFTSILLTPTSVEARKKRQYMDVRTYIPLKAYDMLPTVRKEQEELFPEIPIPHYLGGLIEQESCISLNHSRCWSPTSELNTKRELGVGFFQITKAYKKDGSIRFDTLKNLRKSYPRELDGLSWQNIRGRPELQIRAGILLLRENYRGLRVVPDEIERLKMADSAFNGGLGNVKKARKRCALTRGCDKDVWDDNVARKLPQSRAAIYGNRSPYFINTEHVELIFNVRTEKYRPFFE